MKTKLSLLFATILIAAQPAKAQSFTDGTNALSAENLAAANSDFADAVAANPTGPVMNFYYALTRLLILPTQPAGSTFLTQLGFSTTGRDVFHWETKFPKSKNHRPEFPQTYNIETITAQARTNVLPVLVAAQTNLAQITSPSFLLDTSETVTHFPSVTIDYGDVLMLRALDYGAQVWFYTLYSWNFNVQIGAASNVIATDKSIEAVLQSFPSALTYMTTADAAASKSAFSNAANLYLSASDFIRNERLPGTYLFNLDVNDSSEEHFRQTLTNLLASLSNGPQPLPGNPNYTVSMANFFSDTSPLRSWLPQFDGKSFIWNSFPDKTLGGLITGLSETNLGQFIIKTFKLGAELQLPGVSVSNLYTFENYVGLNGVILGKDGNIYGTTQYGGTFNYNTFQQYGSIFKRTPAGTLTRIYDFDSDTNNNPEGNMPNDIIQGSGTDTAFYGTTQYGGTNGEGSIFKFAVSGNTTKVTTLYDFGSFYDQYGNVDGLYPQAALVHAPDGNLYGTTEGDGYDSYGTVFSISPSGQNFSLVYAFSGGQDGASPMTPLIVGADNNLYGTTSSGGTNNDGGVFEIVLNSGGTPSFVPVYSFGAVTNDFGTPLDGVNPNGLTLAADGSIYGTTSGGGANDPYTYGYYGFTGDGTAFRITSTGGVFSFQTLFSFDSSALDDYVPIAQLVRAGNGTLYGTTYSGGANGRGAIYSLAASGAQSQYWFTKDSGGNPGPAQGMTLGADGNYYGTTSGGNIYRFAITPGAPAISSEPAGVTINLGVSTSLTVGAAGAGTLSYQWYQGSTKLANGPHLSGVTSPTLNIISATAASAGSYKVIVTSPYGTATSLAAVVTVTSFSAPSIIKEPASLTVDPGGIASFPATVTGTPPFGMRWFYSNGGGFNPLSDGSPIFGSASNDLVINPVSGGYAGTYFLMVSNAYGTAQSTNVKLSIGVERTSPSVTITAPTAGLRTTNPVFSGTATDAVRVQGVHYWITNLTSHQMTAVDQNATLNATAGVSSNWVISSPSLVAGSNSLTVQSYNYSGSNSLLVARPFFFEVGSRFQTVTNPVGSGSIVPTAVVGQLSPTNGASLYIGQSYTVTAKPGLNMFFTNWTENGGVVGTNASLTFMMQPNLVLTANFVTNLFIGMAGRYDGIFLPDNPLSPTIASSGMIGNLQLRTNGSYTATMYLAGQSYPLAGTFNMSGQTTGTVSRLAAIGSITYGLDLAWTDTSPYRYITGEVQDKGLDVAGGPVGWVSSNLFLCAARSSNIDMGQYTALLPQNPVTEDSPVGDGYLIVSNKSAVLTLSGAMPDGATFSQSVPIGEDNEFPVYSSLYPPATPGLLLGRLSLTPPDGAVPTNDLIWIRPAIHGGPFPAGFSVETPVQGSPWTNSLTALANTFPASVQLMLSGGGLVSPADISLVVTSSNALATFGAKNGLRQASINRTNGVLTVVFTNTPNHTLTGYGSLLQNVSSGGGYFINGTNAGSILLTPSSAIPTVATPAPPVLYDEDDGADDSQIIVPAVPGIPAPIPPGATN